MPSGMLKNNAKSKEAIMYVTIVIASVLLILIQLDFLNRDFNSFPDIINNDGVYYEATVKAVYDDGFGGVFHVSRLGGSNGASWIEFFNLDYVITAILCFFRLLGFNAPQMMYATYILSFPMSAVSFAYLLRKLRIQRGITGVFSILFVLAPYHFWRNWFHFILSMMHPIPLSVVVALYIAGFQRDTISKREVIYLSLFIGLCCPYYSFFALIIWAISLLYRFLDMYELDIKQRVVQLKDSLLPFVFIAITLALTIAPTIISRTFIGENPEPSSRAPWHAELYGMKISQLFIPSSYSKIPFFDVISNKYLDNTLFVNENEASALGLIGTIALVYFLYYFVRTIIRPAGTDKFLKYISLSVVIIMLVATTSGIGLLFNMYIYSQFRCYCRMSIMIYALVLMGMAYVINTSKLIDKAMNKSLLLVALAVIGIWDLLPYPWVQGSDYQELNNINREFYGSIEDIHGSSGLVYQLPHSEFPYGSRVNNMQDYEHLVAYLYTQETRWSSGGIRGRDYESRDSYIDQGLSEDFLDNLLELGYTGVLIDINGYPENYEEYLEYYDSLGITRIDSGDGVHFYYDIAELTQ